MDPLCPSRLIASDRHRSTPSTITTMTRSPYHGLQHSRSSPPCLYQQSTITRDKSLESVFTFKTNQEFIVDCLVKLRVYPPGLCGPSTELLGGHDVEAIDTSPSFLFVDSKKALAYFWVFGTPGCLGGRLWHQHCLRAAVEAA